MSPFNAKAAHEMRSAFEGAKKGALVCESPEAKRLVFFENGDLVGARSSLAEDRLGSVLVREGRISEAERDKAFSFVHTGRRLGEILVELDFLKPGEIETYVRVQILDIACAALTSPSTRLVFSEIMEVEAATLSPISIGAIFLAAVRQLPDVKVYRDEVLLDDYLLAQTDGALALASGMELSTSEAMVLDLVDGANAVRDIVAASPLEEEQTIRILIALHEAGVVAVTERKKSQEAKTVAGPRPVKSSGSDPFEKEIIGIYNNMQCQNHWQVLGLPRDVGYEAVEVAYGTLFHRFDLEQWEHIADESFQEKLSFVRTRVKEAYLTLSSQTSANVYSALDEHENQYQEGKQQRENVDSEKIKQSGWERPKDPEMAAGLFNQAKHAFREADFWRTIELCRQSIELADEPVPARYHILGLALAENPRWRKDAEANLKIAIKLEPWEPRYLISLGQLYDQEGLHERAERTFEQVRAVDPDIRIPERKTENGEPVTKGKKKKTLLPFTRSSA